MSEENIIILNDENGNEVEFEFLELISYRQKEYVVLFPLHDSDGQVVILQLEEADEETENYVSVENEFVLETVFALNILLITAVFGSSGSIVGLILIYFITVAISLSPIGEMCLAVFVGAKDIKRVDIKLRVVPLVQYVLDKAKENTSYCPKKVKVMIIHDPAPNAFALGKRTLCITDGLLMLSDDLILGVLAHEIGHLSYGHTVIQLLIGGGNVFISGCLLLIKISYWVFSAIMGLFAIGSRSGVMGLITAMFAGISTALSWLWVKFCMLFLMWSMRQNEYLADEFAHRIGFCIELATVLEQHLSDVPYDDFLRALYATHPCNGDRVAALQNLGVHYFRY